MRRYTIEVGGELFVIDVEELSLDRFEVQVGGQRFEVRLAADEQLGGQAITPAILPLDGAPGPEPADRGLPAAPAQRRPSHPATAGAGELIRAPMPGTVLALAVAPGEPVAAGQALLTLEAMKMQNTLRAPRAGVVAAVLVQPGEAVAHGKALLQLAEARQ